MRQGRGKLEIIDELRRNPHERDYFLLGGDTDRRAFFGDFLGDGGKGGRFITWWCHFLSREIRGDFARLTPFYLLVVNEG
jgi:hypothetical protein